MFDMKYDSSYLMEYMSWPEIDSAIKSGKTSVVICVGAIEQHGYHLPIATDALLGTAVACKVSELLGDALAAPVIRPGFSPHHMGFKGSVTLSHDTLYRLICDYVKSYGEYGFETVIVICSHGGNSPTLRLACQKLREENPPYSIIPIYDVMQYSCMNYPYFGPKEGYHANRLETSWMLYLYPELVRMEQAKAGGSLEALPIRDYSVPLFHGRVKDFSETGAIGDPTQADAALGEASFSELTSAIADDIRHFKTLFPVKESKLR